MPRGRLMLIAGALALPIALGGCGSSSPPASAPRVERAPVPGTFAIYVEPDAWINDVTMDSWWCRGAEFEFDGRSAFDSGFQEGLETLVEKAVVVSSPLSETELAAAGYDGQILVRALDVQPVLGYSQGFLSPRMDLRLEAGANVTISTPSGTLIDTHIDTNEQVKSPAAPSCGGNPETFEDIAVAAVDSLLDVTAQQMDVAFRGGAVARTPVVLPSAPPAATVAREPSRPTVSVAQEPSEPPLARGPIPGKFALYVVPGEWNSEVVVDSQECRNAEFEFDGRDVFYKGFAAGLQAMVADGVPVTTPMSGEALAAEGFRGQITVASKRVEPVLSYSEGVLSPRITLRLLADAQITVSTPNGVLLETTVVAEEEVKSRAAPSCGGAPEAFEDVTVTTVDTLVEATARQLTATASLYATASAP